jgi:peptidoglycan hydrolase-like protein with peptidoglycan-binding domain
MTNPIYDLMYRGESGAAGYNAYNRGTYTDANGRERIRPGNPPMDFSRFTLGEIQDMQDLPRRDPDRVFAIGKYQIIPGTMDAAVARLGLDRNQPFTPELQDRIFSEYLLRDKQPSVRDYIEGRPGATLQQAQHGLAREWASFGDPNNGGRSYYGGANRAHITIEQSAAALDQMRTEYATAIGRGLSADDAWRAATAIEPQTRTQAPPVADTSRPEPSSPERSMILRQGSQGPEVQQLQTTLNALGYRGANDQPLETRSGMFGRETDHALRDFQRAHGLEVDGKIGPDTRAALARTVQQPLVSEATHPNHPLYTAIGRQLPPATDPRATANITLQAIENGITSPEQLAGVAVRGSDVYLMGTTPGFRAQVDLHAPTADLQSMSDHMREQAQQQTRQPHQLRGTQTIAV